MNRYFLVGFLTLFSAASYLAFLQFQGKDTDSEMLGRPLAVIREIQNDVKHKHTGDFFWKTSADGKKLYDHSQVFVGSNSSAVLVFSEKQKARLSAETLLTLTQNGETATPIALRLNDGGFNLKNSSLDNKPIIINLDDGHFTVGASSAFDLYVKKINGSLALSMASGKIQLEGVDGKKDLAQGDSVFVKGRTLKASSDKNGKQIAIYVEEIENIKLTPLYPQDGEILYTQENPVFFKWEVTEAGPLFLQYSSHPDFSDNFKEIEVTSQGTLPIPFKDLKDDVFWRLVLYQDSIPSFSKTSFFKIGKAQGVTLKSSPLTFVRKGKWRYEATIAEADSKSAQYEFQLSHTDDFASLVDAFTGTPPFSSLLESSGEYFIRARKVYENGLHSSWSSLEKVKVRDDLRPPKIDLTKRQEDSLGNIYAEIEWPPVVNAADYIVQTSNKISFDVLDSSKVSKESHVSFKHSGPHRTFYRILARSPEGETSLPSNVLIVEPATTLAKAAGDDRADLKSTSKTNSSLEASNEKTDADKFLLPLDGHIFYVGEKVKFEWDPSFTHPTIEVSRIREFTQDVERFIAKETTRTEISTTARSGKYFWRLSYGDPSKPKFSKVQEFAVEAALATLISKVSAQFIERGKWELALKINEAADQEPFLVQASLDKNFEKNVLEITGPLTQKLPLTIPGNYFVRARKISGSPRTQRWSNTVSQFIRPPLEAPSLDKQEEALAGAQTISIKLEWKAVDYATQYLLEMSETEGFGNILKSALVPANNYVLEHSQSTPSYIRVRALSAEGERSATSNVFKVKGLLPGPSIEKYDVVFANFDDKKDTDKLHVLWSHRKNAQKYVVEISRTEDMKNAEQVETKNIELFKTIKDLGWYYFRVRPITDSKDFFFAPTIVYGVEYKKLGNLLGAKVEKPADGFVAPIKNGKYSLQFQWGQILGAGWYELELSQSADFSKSTLFKVEARDYWLKQGLTPGTWYYRLRGRNNNQTSPWSSPQTLTLK